MEQTKYIIKFLLMLISHPQDLWEYLTDPEVSESKPEYVQEHYYLPLWGFMSLVIFLCEGFYGATGDSSFDLQIGMKQAVPYMVAFLVGPFLAMLLLRLLLVHAYDVKHPSKDRLHLFVFFCTSFLMALEMLLAFIPSIRFFWFIVVYIVYLTWTGSTTIIRVEEKNRWMFGFLSAVVIYFSSHIFISLIQKMQWTPTA